MSQLSFDRHETVADLPQRFGLTQLAKQHGHKLAPTTETPRVALGFVFLHGFLEFHSWEQLEQLGKNAAYSIQGGRLLIGFGLW